MTGRRVRHWRILCVLAVASGLLVWRGAGTEMVAHAAAGTPPPPTPNPNFTPDPKWTPPPSPKPPTRAEKAARWAEGQIGKTGWSLRCEYFAEQSYGTSGKYVNPLAAYADFKRQKLIHTDKQPPRGALTLYDTWWTDSKGGKHHDGHIVVARGSGSFVTTPSGWDGNKVHTAKIDTFPGYLGWAYPPSSWGSR